jgi:hypothetical protein
VFVCSRVREGERVRERVCVCERARGRESERERERHEAERENKSERGKVCVCERKRVSERRGGTGRDHEGRGKGECNRGDMQKATSVCIVFFGGFAWDCGAIR